jgi:lipid-A-disaccharide synthase
MMTDDAPLFFIIAGEPSGDLIGAALMRALCARMNGHVRFAGVGGESMAAEGLRSLVPIRELAIMGVLEVLPSARRILRRVRETVTAIRAAQPVAVITIDSSGFCFRVGDKLKETPIRPLIIHYVAPMVWAWRPRRALNAARAADHLLTLLPFEPPYFERVGLPATYVGHPVVEGGADRGDGARFRAKYGLADGTPLLSVLPGSRGGEVRRLLPVFWEAIARLALHYPALTVVLPTVGTVADLVADGTRDWPVPVLILRETAEKFDAFAASHAGLAASGTVSLELALARLPMVIAYKVFPPTAWLLKRVLKTPHASLVNILLGRAVIPELLQQACTPENLAGVLENLMTDEALRAAQVAGCAEALAMIGLGAERPSLRAADRILELTGLTPTLADQGL